MCACVFVRSCVFKEEGLCLFLSSAKIGGWEIEMDVNMDNDGKN